MWKILKDIGISEHLNCLLLNLYTVEDATVRTRHASKLGKIILRVYTCKVIQLYPYKCPFFFKLFSHLGETTYFSLLGVCLLNYEVKEVAKSCLTLCDSMDCSLPGFSIHGIFQARVLEWVAYIFAQQIFLKSQIIRTYISPPFKYFIANYYYPISNTLTK